MDGCPTRQCRPFECQFETPKQLWPNSNRCSKRSAVQSSEGNTNEKRDTLPAFFSIGPLAFERSLLLFHPADQVRK